ncbi:hypothetical protein Acsp03_55540 [Actinomadura sp. NBRC 104412]|nr:hypothetical protein Acsp03_55540 [Actinomadura sp. NBRC 104412]
MDGLILDDLARLQGALGSTSYVSLILLCVLIVVVLAEHGYIGRNRKKPPRMKIRRSGRHRHGYQAAAFPKPGSAYHQTRGRHAARSGQVPGTAGVSGDSRAGDDPG